MKKIVFLLIVCSFVSGGFSPVWAAKKNNTHSCGPVTLSYFGTQELDDDEFLYADDHQYQLSKNGYANFKKKNSGDGKGYECDSRRTGSCTTDDVVTLGAGHWFKGQRVNYTRTYICVTHFIGDDRWEEYSKKETCTANGHTWDVGTSLSVGGQNYFPSEWCSGFDRTEQDFKLVKSWEVKCLKENTFKCFAHECVGGYRVDSNGKCVKDASDDQCTFPDGKKYNVGQNIEYDCSKAPNGANFTANAKTGDKCYVSCLKKKTGGAVVKYWSVKTCPKNYKEVAFTSSDQIYTTVIPGYKRCVQQEQLNFCERLEKKHATPERVLCCKAGSQTKWMDANGVEQKDSTGLSGERCVCVDGKGNIDPSKVWNSTTGQCDVKEAQQDEQPVLPESGKMCYYTFKGTIDCGNGKRVTRTVYKTLSLEEVQKKYHSASCEEFQSRYEYDVSELKDLADAICNEYGKEVQLDAATKNAIRKVNEFFGMSNANRTVWRDTEGKFNATRLASDATAGVVLGTVGGIVSGKVIKKKQLEKGFDVLHCTVGGQKMADYGDTFQVSFYR